jgi:DNA-binding NtrC family response regulator
VDDFIVWPAPIDELLHRLRRLTDGEPELHASHEELMAKLGLAQLVGHDAAFVSVLEKIPILARCEGPVLITGETGTGKELCARAVHHLSKRGRGPFIPVDCGSVPDHLFENELFGHTRGAFTDAREEKRGLAAVAEHGTLFLDEVDTLSSSAQSKLLRFIQERTYRPLGAERQVCGDVMVLAASNRDLEKAVREGAFRSDLYFRLNVLRLQLPPLRERRADIAPLARHVLRVCGEGASQRKTLSSAALGRLMDYEWPGNVRELINVVQRAFVFSRTTRILARDIVLASSVAAEAPPGAAFTLRTPFRKARAAAIESFERAYVQAALRRHHGNISRAAITAQKDRRAFGRLVKKYGIDRTAF